MLLLLASCCKNTRAAEVACAHTTSKVMVIATTAPIEREDLLGLFIRWYLVDA